MKHFVAAFFRVLDVLSILCLLVLVVLVFLQVVFRYVHIPSPWTEELARFAFIYVTFLGSVIALRDGTHIEIDALLATLSDRNRHLARAVGFMLIIAFLYLFTRGLLLTIQTSGAVRSSSLVWFEMKYIFVVVLISAVAMMLVSVVRTVEHIHQAIRLSAQRGQA